LVTRPSSGYYYTVWEFLGTVLERHGLASAIAIGVIGSFGYAIRTLWLKNAELQAAVVKSSSDVGDRIATIQVRNAEQLAQSRVDCERDMLQFRDQLADSTLSFSRRLDELHEKRNTEMREVLREVVEHVGETRRSVDKITDSMQTLRELLRRP
jgi:hypothetical protein